ncbi:MAG TPA: 1-acyl-sn-glycerol-3-phosphate acyltransferase [Methylomirabilota bacterium]|jgi:1-acyl-sn-glycerol-3-phosphate acyltransferase|nr:1-acyl-sn-glycerol-3-phosphate acyltransferase [Methylomirabilota bacterium]
MRQHAEPADHLYAFLRLVARFWIWFLFREVAVRDARRVPQTGPVLLCVNHPNNLVDSLLLAAVLPRKVHYLANSSLFRNPALARFLAGAGVIPVHRRTDSPDGADRSVQTFAASRRTLEAGHVLAIYPEGTTHAETRVQRIKTGAARIALDYEAGRAFVVTAARPALALIPVGLSFEARKSFRSRVLIAFGEPVALERHAAKAREDPVAATQALTDDIQSAMEAQVVHVERIEVAEVVRAVEELYRDELVRQLRAAHRRPPEAIDVFRLSRTIVEAVGHFKVRDPDRVARLWQDIQHYRALLAAYHVRDQAVGARLARGDAPHPLRAAGWAVAGLPVFLYGAAVNALPYLIPRRLAHSLARKETDYATIRLLSSIAAFPLCWGLETWLVWRAAGAGWAVAFALSLPLSGLLAYRYLRGLGRLRARARFLVLALTRRQAASWILTERRKIIDALEWAREDFLADRDRDRDRARVTPDRPPETPGVPLDAGTRPAGHGPGTKTVRSAPARGPEWPA